MTAIGIRDLIVIVTADRRILVATFSPAAKLATIPTVYVVHDDHQTEVSEPDVIESAGKAYPLAIRWLGARPELRLDEAMAGAILTAWREETGDILAFLPGVGEIERTKRSLLAATRDSRLGFQFEQDYVYTPYSLREKLRVLRDTLKKQLPAARSRLHARARPERKAFL